ncbi:uncharacterized protein LOC134038705 [Osmerus eperlanus]|uniref:uncharacterized protein LOC134038705 n=1 Tax=Osmerus eperlanus TaxID=29151 RepID=UPI002E163EA2
MATSSPRFTWCDCRKHKIPVKDTHELCLHCLGLQHAKEAVLEYGKCPHCASMDWSTCINRLTKVQEVMHRESQQRKHEAARSEVQPKPEASAAPISQPKAEPDPGPTLPPAHLSPAASTHPSSIPVVFTLLPPPPPQMALGPGGSRAAYLSQLAVQQSADSTPSISHLGPHGLTAISRKRRHFSSCRSRCSQRAKRSRVGHRRRHSPSSSSSSPCWSSGEDSCASGTGRRSGRGTGRGRRRHCELLEVLQQRLVAQQQAVHMQWSLLDKRIEALERRPAEAATLLSVSSQTSCAPQKTSRDVQQQREQLGSSSEQLVTASITVVKQEEEPSSISSVSRPLSDAEREEASQSADALSQQDLLEAKELQSLVARAASYLGVDFPSSASGPPDPTMVPEFEELVQSSWQNPASSLPHREHLSRLYRLHDWQSPAYQQMPQVSCFMSAIFQAVTPSEKKDSPLPAEQLRVTEMLVEKMYETGGMLAKTANYLRYLSDYQRRLLEEVAKDQHAQRFGTVLDELKLIGQFTLLMSSHQAELSGRVMSASVAVRRQIWMAKTSYTDSLKATVADLPFVVSHAFGVGSGPSSSGTKQEVAEG